MEGLSPCAKRSQPARPRRTVCAWDRCPGAEVPTGQWAQSSEFCLSWGWGGKDVFQLLSPGQAVFPLLVYGASKGGKGSCVVMLSQRERGELFEGQGDRSCGFWNTPLLSTAHLPSKRTSCFCPVISTVNNFLLRVGVCCASVPCRYGPGIHP